MSNTEDQKSPKLKNQKLSQRSKKSKLRAIISLTLTLAVLNHPIKCKIYRFKSGTLEDFPNTEFALYSLINRTEESTPRGIMAILGTLELVPLKNSTIWFQIYYRKTTDSSYQENLILELRAPFALDMTYQDRELDYSTENRDPRFRIREEDIHLYRLETDFHIFKGQEVTKEMVFIRLSTRIFVERLTKRVKGRKWGLVISPKIKAFEVVFGKDQTIHRLTVDPNSLDDGPMGEIAFSTVVMIAAPIIIILLQNLIAFLLSSNLEAKKEMNQFQGSFLTVIISPFAYTVIWQYYEFQTKKILSGGLILMIFLSHVASFKHLHDLYLRPQKKYNFVILIFLANLVINGAWIYLVVFKRPWLLLVSQIQFAGVFLLDLAVLACTTKMRLNGLIMNAFMAILRGFLSQLITYNLFFIEFYFTHAEIPGFLDKYLLLDFGVMVVLTLLTAFVAKSKGPGKDREGYTQELVLEEVSLLMREQAQ